MVRGSVRMGVGNLGKGKYEDGDGEYGEKGR